MNRRELRLLLVDDSEVMRRSLRAVLESLGFTTIDEAGDGAEALKCAAHRRYDLVISDWQMPHLDGIGFLRHLRSWPEGARLPVLLVTGDDSDGRVREALEAGANGLLAKPFPSQTLDAHLRRLLGGEVRDAAAAVGA